MAQTTVGSEIIRNSSIKQEDMDPATVCSKKAEFAKTAAPTVNDDGTQGYAVGSRWIDTTNNKEYVCLAAGTGAAVWKETTQAGGGGGVNALTYIGF